MEKEQSPEKTKHELQSPLPEESHRTCLIPVARNCDMWKMLSVGTRWRINGQYFCLGLVTQAFCA